MDAKQEDSFWPYWTSDWHDSYLYENEALFSNLNFQNLHFQPSSSAITPSNALKDELGNIFEDDVLRHWGEMEQADNKMQGAQNGLPQLYYRGDKEEAVLPAMVAGADRVRSEKGGLLTFEVVSRYFYMPIAQAARELGIGLTHLKRRCRELGIPRWPHRKMKSLQSLIKNVQEAGKAPGKEKLSALVEMLQQEKQLLEQRPFVELEERTRKLRQACFKANHNKKRRLLALEARQAGNNNPEVVNG